MHPLAVVATCKYITCLSLCVFIFPSSHIYNFFTNTLIISCRSLSKIQLSMPSLPSSAEYKKCCSQTRALARRLPITKNPFPIASVQHLQYTTVRNLVSTHSILFLLLTVLRPRRYVELKFTTTTTTKSFNISTAYC